ncbi:YggT family protein [Companilactobacillus kimchiensis]|uniref:YggT family protein n=1 Tax=Companilactobacillus kimchiensis TaxID=993692 RepID=UPI00070A1143|nr:YggT family protein [Companilactobacillus kimchiensis]
MDRILSGLPQIIGGAFELYEFIIFVYCLLSFIPSLNNSVFGRLVASVVDPFLNLIRRVLPIVSTGILDFSPIVALILIQLLQKVIFMMI